MKKGVRVCARVRASVCVCVSCMLVSEPLLPSCSGVCLPLELFLDISSYSLEPPNFQGTTRKMERTEQEDLTSATGRDLEIEKYDVCDILRFVCPVFTWFCLQSCVSATEQ